MADTIMTGNLVTKQLLLKVIKRLRQRYRHRIVFSVRRITFLGSIQVSGAKGREDRVETEKRRQKRKQPVYLLILVIANFWVAQGVGANGTLYWPLLCEYCIGHYCVNIVLAIIV